MGVTNAQKTVKTIFKNLTNTKGFATFKPNWVIEFTDGMKAKIPLDQMNAEMICGKVAEGKSFLFTIEDGVYNEKPWWAIRDLLASGGMPTEPIKTQETHHETQKTTTFNGAELGNRLSNITNICIAQIDKGDLQPDMDSIIKRMEGWNQVFKKYSETGVIAEIPF